jgi:hypothetical protein
MTVRAQLLKAMARERMMTTLEIVTVGWFSTMMSSFYIEGGVGERVLTHVDELRAEEHRALVEFLCVHAEEGGEEGERELRNLGKYRKA